MSVVYMDKELREKVLIEEIKMVQDIIKRMAGNSFLLKGWALTLVVAPFLLNNNKTQGNQLLLAYFPLFIFWGLDAYFLHQEKLYRALHKWVANNRLNTDEYLFDFVTNRFRKDCEPLYKTFCSTTLVVFYGLIAVLIGGYYYWVWGRLLPRCFSF
jgi:hypothetical protein